MAIETKDKLVTLEDLKASHTYLKSELSDVRNTLNHKADVIYDTASGDIASFPDGADGLPVKDLTVGIEPVQDLHGYDYPWPAGGMGNLFPSAESGSYGSGSNIVTISRNANMSFSLTKTGTEWVRVPLGVIKLPAGTYTIIQEQAGQPNVDDALALYTNPDTAADYNTRNSKRVVFTISEEKQYYCYYNIATTSSDTTIKAMLFAGDTKTASDYVPYSNICPISGWAGANVARTGKNLLPELASKTELGITFTEDDNGVLTMNGTTSAGGRIFLWQGELIVKEACILSIGTSAPNFNFNMGVSGNNNAILVNNGTGIASVPPGKYTSVSVYVGAAGTQYNVKMYPMLRLASDSDTTFAQYQGTTLPISWQSSAGTVYGGTLDVTTGVLTVTDAYVDMGSVSWNKNTDFGYTFFSAASGSVESKGNLACSSYKPVKKARDSLSNGEIGTWNTTNAFSPVIRDDSKANLSNTEFKTAMSGVQLVYELAQPQTYHLAPEEVTTLLGQNNIWADCGQSTVEYPADTKLYIQKINTPTDDDMIADANIASGQYFIVNNNLYLSTAAILAGDPIKPGTNCTLTNLAAALNAINS